MVGTNSMLRSDIEAKVFRIEKTNSSSWVKKHENWHIQKNDIALIKTSKPIEFIIKDGFFAVNSICLPEPDYEQIGLEVIVTGWGNINRNLSDIKIGRNLQKKSFSMVDKEECSKLFGKKSSYWNVSMICTIDKPSPIITGPSPVSLNKIIYREFQDVFPLMTLQIGGYNILN
jgi:hypothetical protein